MVHYKITLTASGGLQEEELAKIQSYFQKNCSQAYVVNEQGDSGGNSHVEAIASFETTSTSNVTNRMKTLYGIMGMEVSPYSIRCKKVTHLAGAIIYANKETKKDGKVLVLKGWTSSFIDQQVKDNVKSIPHSMLKKKGTRLSQQTAGALIYEYATANNYIVKDKETYRLICIEMGTKGFLFGCVRHKGVFQDVCALFGSGDAIGLAIDSELNFL